MELKDRLKEWRIKNELTQEKAAEKLNVAPQTVSKWERGILAPDVSLIPRIAMLYHTSTDELLGMNEFLEENAEEKFNIRLNELYREEKWQECAALLEEEIGRAPDRFELYSALTRVVMMHKLYDTEGIRRLDHLAKRVELFCHSNDIRAAVCKNMMMICMDSGDKSLKDLAHSYRDQMPSIYSSRELYGIRTLEGIKLDSQLRANAFVLADFLEMTIRKMITDDKNDEEKLELYLRAAGCCELLQMDPGRYTIGILEIQMLFDMGHAAQTAFQLNRTELGEELLGKIRVNLDGLEKGSRKLSPMILNGNPAGMEQTRKSLEKFMSWYRSVPEFQKYLQDTDEKK